LNTIRIMTYQVDGCRGCDDRVSIDRILDVIAEGAPDIVALQGIDAEPNGGQVALLARQLGMSWYANHQVGANAFLSYYPLSALQDYPLGGNGTCLRADTTVGDKRLHLFNVCLDAQLGRRLQQINRLLGPELLGHPSLACPTLLLGDFADLIWGVGNMNLALTLRKARRPWWPGTFPARFPVFGRDRAYLKGELRVVESSIIRSATARSAAKHLPLIMTLQLKDPRTYLRADKLAPGRMEVATG
jgi:endonuclease/exonuclease/phosphatase family metal-dependent hydrolase